MDDIKTIKNEKKENSFDLKAILDKQPHLSHQSYETLNKEVSPITYEIMSRQATINIGIKLDKFRNDRTRCPRKDYSSQDDLGSQSN